MSYIGKLEPGVTKPEHLLINILHCLYSGLWMDFLHFFYTDWKKSASLQEKDFSMNNWVVFSDILRWMETHGFEVIIQQKCVNLLICLMQNSLYNCYQFLENEGYDLAILWGHREKWVRQNLGCFIPFLTVTPAWRNPVEVLVQRTKTSFQYPVGFFLSPDWSLQMWSL